MQKFDSAELARRHEEGWSTNTNWRPQTAEGKDAFAELIAEENRQALKKWYLNFSALNKNADMFRHILEVATGEKLPLKR
jgi:hypothetical protein